MKNAQFFAKGALIFILPLLILIVIVLATTQIRKKDAQMTEEEKKLVEEGQPKLGMNYITYLGPGITGSWDDLDVFGEKLSIQSSIWKKLQGGNISYKIGEFLGYQHLSFICSIGYLWQDIKAFHENSFFLSGGVEAKINEEFTVSFAGMFQWMKVQDSPFDGTFDLVKVPIQISWNNTDDKKEPTKGIAVEFDVIPSFQAFNSTFVYMINTLSGKIYQPLTQSKRNIISIKLMIGSIFAAANQPLPSPDLFYEGSYTTLRGYRYWTVSPLSPTGKPLGGRSMFLFSLELLNKIGKNLGLILFYDAGNVYANSTPDFTQGLLQSAGVGIRYYTPIGPIRLDAAFPLNKRPIDNSMEVYFSIGQSF